MNVHITPVTASEPKIELALFCIKLRLALMLIFRAPVLEVVFKSTI